MKEAKGIIYLQSPDGEEFCRAIMAHPERDNQETMRQHFEEHSFLWPSGTVFVGAEVWKN